MILGDPHLPGRLLEKKKRVIEKINSWNDVELVVSVGDVCAGSGTSEEFDFAANFFSGIKAPFLTLIGNHDNYYADSGFVPAKPDERLRKIALFCHAFSGQQLYFHRLFNGVRVFFLALDGIESNLFSAVSKKQLEWFETELNKDRVTPTVVFYHAPLWTEEVVRIFPLAVNYIAQPACEFRRIVKASPQIKIWVSGHVHFGMVSELLNHSFNRYEGLVTNILNCDMDGFSVLDRNLKPVFHEQIWTRSLYLSPKSWRCTVFDHDADCEIPELETGADF